jgi:integrase
MTHTFSLLYYLRKEKMDKEGKVPICLRITVEGKRSSLPTHQKIKPDRWNSKAQKVNGTNQETRSINAFLDNLKYRVQTCYRELGEKGGLITADIIRGIVLGNTANNRHTLIEAFEKHNKRMGERVEIDVAKETHKRYITTLKLVKEFIKYTYHKNDIYLMELHLEFITDLEHYYKTVRDCSHNTAIKYNKNLCKITNLALENGWLLQDPFIKYKTHLERVEQVCLDENELKSIEKLVCDDRLNRVKDIFLFCCYTGLSYVDVTKLTAKDIVTIENSDKIIYMKRTKTKTPFCVLLLPPALEILKKYENDTECLHKGKLLPARSNQKLNEYLKEIATLSGINENLSMHVARRTFATLCSTYDIADESIKRILGHRNVRTTQESYVKIRDEKVIADMRILRNKLYNDSSANIDLVNLN